MQHGLKRELIVPVLRSNLEMKSTAGDAEWIGL